MWQMLFASMLINQFRGELINNQLFFVELCAELVQNYPGNNKAETGTKMLIYLIW